MSKALKRRSTSEARKVSEAHKGLEVVVEDDRRAAAQAAQGLQVRAVQQGQQERMVVTVQMGLLDQPAQQGPKVTPVLKAWLETRAQQAARGQQVAQERRVQLAQQVQAARRARQVRRELLGRTALLDLKVLPGRRGR